MEFEGMGAFGGCDDDLPVCPEALAQRWWTFLATESPWDGMRNDDAFGYMRRILSELLNEARDIDHDERRLRLVLASGSHGAFRRAQRCTLPDLVHEFELVVAAVHFIIRENGYDERMARDTITCLAPELRLSLRMAAQGWHRPAPSETQAAVSPDRHTSKAGGAPLARWREVARRVAQLTATVSVMLGIGCTVARVPSRRVDTLVARYSGHSVLDFGSRSELVARAAPGFVVQSADLSEDWPLRFPTLGGSDTVRARALRRLVLTTADSTVLSAAIREVEAMFHEPALEACSLRADGTSDRALIWRVDLRGGVIVTTPALPSSRAAAPWKGRLILVREAVRRADVGQRVLDVPCSEIATDEMLVTESHDTGQRTTELPR